MGLTLLTQLLPESHGGFEDDFTEGVHPYQSPERNAIAAMSGCKSL